MDPLILISTEPRVLCEECGCCFVWDETQDIVACPLCGHVPDDGEWGEK